MFIILMAFMLVCVYGMKLAPLKGFNDGYSSREDTTAIKGIFVFMVFISHFTQYYQMHTAFDNPYKLLKTFLGQLIVVMFLFYSGYGIFESVKRKGSGYINTFPKNRCLKTLLHLDIAVLIFLIFDFIIGQKVTLVNFLLALVGWSSIGNSNWFMLAIIIQYIIVYISFTVFKKKKLPAICLVTVLSVVYIIAMAKFKEDWYYNTALCLPFGMWYSYFKDSAEKFIMKNNITYIITWLVFGAIFTASYLKRDDSIVFYEIFSVSFCMIVVLFTIKAHIGNKVLEWLGNHVFSVYILQRLPMTALRKIEMISTNRYLYFALSLIITVIISELFDRAMKVIDKKLFKVKKA